MSFRLQARNGDTTLSKGKEARELAKWENCL